MAAEFLEPPLRGLVHPVTAPSGASSTSPGPSAARFEFAGLTQQAHPDAFADVRGEPTDEPHLVRGKGPTARFPVQAEIAPADTPYPQHRAKLVLQAERRENVAVASAARRAALGRLREVRTPRLRGQLGPLVDVIVRNSFSTKYGPESSGSSSR